MYIARCVYSFRLQPRPSFRWRITWKLGWTTLIGDLKKTRYVQPLRCVLCQRLSKHSNKTQTQIKAKPEAAAEYACVYIGGYKNICLCRSVCTLTYSYLLFASSWNALYVQHVLVTLVVCICIYAFREHTVYARVSCVLGYVRVTDVSCSG